MFTVEPNKHSLVASDNSDHVIDTQEDLHREFGELHQIYRSHEEKLRGDDSTNNKKNLLRSQGKITLPKNI